MKNRNIILTAILSLLVCGALSCMAQTGLPTANVNVVNTTTNPVPVADAENPARNAVQQRIDIQFGLLGSPGGGVGFITIPANEIFVLETVSLKADVGVGGTLVSLNIEVTDSLITGGQGQVRYFLTIPPPSAPGSGLYGGSQALRLYAQPGTHLIVNCSRTLGNAPPIVSVSLSGYFVSTQ